MELKEKIRKSAVDAILRKARNALGSLHRPYSLVNDEWEKYPDSELDLEASIEFDPLLENILIERKKLRRAEVVICLDTSLSMTGKKLALLAVSVGVLALQLDAEDFSVISFESDARLIKGLNDKFSPAKVIENFLESPARGLTNMEAALKLAKNEISKGKQSRQAVILMSDGKFTAGGRPDYLAPQLPKLHVVQAGNPWSNSRFFKGLARKGRGSFLKISDLEDLPKSMYNLVGQILN